MKKTTTIAICNQKGGCGKTTTSINLSAGLMARGKKILLIDCDPQATLTRAYKVKVSKITLTGYQFILDQQEVRVKINELLDLIPASSKLNQLSNDLITDPEGSMYLKNAVEQIKEEYDYVIIDCPPQVSILANNCYTAADEVIIPVFPGTYSLEGIVLLKNQLDKIRRYFNPDLRIAGILITNMDRGTRAANDIQSMAKEAAQRLETVVFHEAIPHSTVINDAQKAYQSLLEYRKNHQATKAYESFVEEVINHE